MRILGFMELFGLVISNIVSVRRLPPKDASGPFIDFSVFRYLPYTIYCIAATMTGLGLYTVRPVKSVLHITG